MKEVWQYVQYSMDKYSILKQARFAGRVQQLRGQLHQVEGPSGLGRRSERGGQVGRRRRGERRLRAQHHLRHQQRAQEPGAGKSTVVHYIGD